MNVVRFELIELPYPTLARFGLTQEMIEDLPMRVLDEMRRDLSVVLARGICKNVTCDEVHQLVDEIFMLFSRGQKEE